MAKAKNHNGNGADPTANGLTAQILEYLTLRGIQCWRNNTGAYAVEGKTGRRFIRFGKKGSGDILGIIPPDGRFLSIEVKVGKDKPRDAQREWMADVVQHGGIAMIARSIEDVYRVFDPLIGVPMLAAPLTGSERVPCPAAG